MAARVLIIPDKFKGTLSAGEAAQAIARGWQAARRNDAVTLLPMSDGGDGFGEVMGNLLGAQKVTIKTVNAAHEPMSAHWWWQPDSRTAIIESARVIGLAQLPPGRFHPFALDTRGLGRVIQAAARRQARQCVIGIGGSATNDGAFGMARALGWQFLDETDQPIQEWTNLTRLKRLQPPGQRRPLPRLEVAVDVQNRLLGPRGCARIYGPQKGLRPQDMATAEAALRRLAKVTASQLGKSYHQIPGAGAAGGLGFGLMAFLGAQPKPGFEIFARQAQLKQRLRRSDVVLTGEGAIDRSSFMGKGVGEVARLCREMGVPCLGLSGVVGDPGNLACWFRDLRGLVEITTVTKARAQAARWLEILAGRMATTYQL